MTDRDLERSLTAMLADGAGLISKYAYPPYEPIGFAYRPDGMLKSSRTRPCVALKLDSSRKSAPLMDLEPAANARLVGQICAAELPFQITLLRPDDQKTEHAAGWYRHEEHRQ